MATVTGSQRNKVLVVDTVNTGQGANELYAMNQNVRTSDNVTFNNVTIAGSISGYATESYVGTQISNLVDSSPLALNTLNELAAALGDDANFSTTVTNSIATKLPLAGGTLTGALSGTTATFFGNAAAGTNALNILGSTNGNGTGITFSDNGTPGASASGQNGYFTYYHGDGASYGSGNAFILTSSEATTTILADGKLMYKEGIYSKPASGTGAGTRKDANWDTAYGWGDHSTAGYTSNVGDITAVTAGTGMTGGGTSGSVTLNVIGGSGITANADNITVDSTVLRTNVNQTITTGQTLFNSGTNMATTSSNQARLEVRGSGSGNDAFMAFHVSGDYATYLGLDGGTNRMSIGGWSMGANSSAIFHDTYHPNADVWTTARSHTVTLSGAVTGTATQSVNGSGNKTWTIATSYSGAITETDTLATVTGRGASTSTQSTFNGGIITANNGVRIKRESTNGSIWFSGVSAADKNHVLWNAYYSTDPSTRGSAGSGFDGIYWNTYRGIKLRGGLNGANNIIVAENSSGSNNDHTVKLYASNVKRFETTTTGAVIENTLLLGNYTDAAKQGQLVLGGNVANKQAIIKCTNGNLHVDADGTSATYLNFYTGSSGTAFGNGASGVAAWMGSDGDLWKGSGDNTGSRYFNDGYHPNADKWTTLRTLFLTGDVTGSVNWDGSGNATMTTTVGNDSHSHSNYTPLDHFRAISTRNYTSTTTSTLMDELLADDYFDSYLAGGKASWNYAGNGNLTDAGRLTELAGCSFLTWTDSSADNTTGTYTAMVIAPTTGGSAGKMFVYNNQGSSYSPGWREVWTSTSDGAGSGLDADLLDGQQGSYYLDYNNFANTPTIPPGDITGVTAGTGMTGGGTSGTVTLNVIGGSGITANADNITVDSTVIRTTGDQSMSGIKTHTSRLALSSGQMLSLGDTNHHLVKVSTGYSGSTVDGPRLQGHQGGELVTNITSNQYALRWDAAGDIHIRNNVNVSANKGIVNSGAWTRNTTPHGYIEFGPANTTWAHIYTDRANFYFNKELYVNNMRVFNTGYHPNADKWTTARSHTVTLTGDVTGTAAQSVDGTGNKTWSITTAVGNNSHQHSQLYENGTIDFGASYVQWTDQSGTGGTGMDGAAPRNPADGWYHNLIMNHANASGYYSQIATGLNTSDIYFSRVMGGTAQAWQRIFADDYHPNADKWTTLRTLFLTGDVTGSVNWDGSGNATMTTTVGNDSHSHSNYVLKAGDTMTGNLTIPDQIIHSGDSNTYMQFHAADQWRVVTGGNERLEVNNSAVSVASVLSIAEKIWHTGDTDTYMTFDAADQWKLYCGGYKMIQATEASSGYDYISFGGTDNSGEILFNVNGGDAHFDGNVYAYSTTTSSDRKLKKNIQPLEGALEKVQNLRGVSFEWKKDDKKSIGFIAQEVQEVVPDLVKLNRKEHDGVLVSEHLGVDYGNITALLVEAMKEQQETINKLEARILALEKGEK